MPESIMHLGDNLPALRLMADKSKDLGLIDPQYGINALNMNMGAAPNRKDMTGNVTTAVKFKGRLNQGGVS